MTFSEKICEAAREGAVLLMNEATLPLTKDDKVAVFGRIQKDWYRSGTGSGGSVHIPYTTNLIDSLRELRAGGEDAPAIDEDLARRYEAWIKENPFDTGGGEWAAEPWAQREMPLDGALVRDCASRCGKAVYVIGRTAGEDKDNAAQKGSWYLTDGEHDALQRICEAFDKVCVVLNVSNIIDTEWIWEPCFRGHITAVLFAWHGGMEGGRACAQILCGKESPSGKLSDTIARRIEDYPSTETFGAAGDVLYKEDIYVGYRYFTTFARDKVRWPFGFGLSYTTFSVEAVECSARIAGGAGDQETAACATFPAEESGTRTQVSVKVRVRNTGGFTAKETVQVYMEPPQGALGKPSRVLAAFAKTRPLPPGGEEVLSLSFYLEDFASYDDSGASGSRFCYVLEPGRYRIYAGTDCLSAMEVSPSCGAELLAPSECRVVARLEQRAAPQKEFERIRPNAVSGDGSAFSEAREKAPAYEGSLEERIKVALPPSGTYTGDRGIKFSDVRKDRSKLGAFISQISDAQLSAMVRGEGMMSQKVTMGICAAFGGITQTLRDMGIPAAGCADGPSGIRLDTGREAHLMPIGTLLACTWNPALVEELYAFEGAELMQYKIDNLLGPGANIHRNPLNGRNFEYYSEDPLLTGIMATSALRGINVSGASGTIKHFAANSQEYCRRSGNSVVSERALREIYLRGFEMAVKSGQVRSLMTSYNAVNGHWTASNWDLVSGILRTEWGYGGLVMTDWWATMNDCAGGGKETIKNTASMVRSGNDVYMIVDNDGAEENCYGDNIQESLDSGSLTRGELERAASHILTFIMDSPVSDRPLGALKEYKSFLPQSESAPDGTAKIYGPGESFLPGDDGECYVHAEEDGMYTVCGVYSKAGDDLSQSVTLILFGTEQAASLECRSTAGVETFVNAAQVHLKKGYYRVSLRHTKPGITVKSLHLVYKSENPVTLGIIN